MHLNSIHHHLAIAAYFFMCFCITFLTIDLTRPTGSPSLELPPPTPMGERLLEEQQLIRGRIDSEYYHTIIIVRFWLPVESLACPSVEGRFINDRRSIICYLICYLQRLSTLPLSFSLLSPLALPPSLPLSLSPSLSPSLSLHSHSLSSLEREGLKNSQVFSHCRQPEAAQIQSGRGLQNSNIESCPPYLCP